MQNSFGLLLLIVFGGLGLVSIFTVIGLLLPVPVNRTRAALETSLGRSLLLGLVNFLCVGLLDALFIVLAQRLGNIKIIAGVLVVIGALLSLALALLSMLGLASLADLLGHHIGEPKNEFHALARGGGLLFLAGLTPFIGWFAFTPLVLLAGLGAAFQTIFKRKE
jgi:hypothetical protein